MDDFHQKLLLVVMSDQNSDLLREKKTVTSPLALAELLHHPFQNFSR